MSWHDAIRIAGLPGDVPSGEVLQGIGSESLRDQRISCMFAYDQWGSDIKGYLGEIWAWIEEQQEAYNNGDAIEESCPVEDLELPTFYRSNQAYLSTDYYNYLFIRQGVHSICNGLIRYLAEGIVKGLSLNGGNSPLTALFKKFAFLEEGDAEQGFPDLTSILLLNADKPLEILLTRSGVDLSLETVVIEEE